MRFTLATKLTVAFAAVAVVPIAAVAVVAQRLVEARYRGEFNRALDAAERNVRAEYDSASHDVERAVDRVARADDPMVGQLLLDLAKGGLDPAGAGSDEERQLREERARALSHRAPEQMRALGLDVFELVDDGGVILASGHYPGHVGSQDPSALDRARRHPKKAILLSEKVVGRGGSAHDAQMIEVATRVQTDYARVTVVGGREISSGFLERLHGLPARLVRGDGVELATTSGGFPTKPYPSRTIPLPGDEPQARIEVAVPNDDLGKALNWIRLAAIAVSIGGLALAILLGAVVARRLSRPLGALAEGARRVAGGDLSASVDIRTGDEVGDLARTFNQMIVDLTDSRERLVHAERVAAWREIARRIAHEIKNPLTPIQMAVETLQRVRRGKPELFDDIFEESSRTILEEVARLKHIVGEFSGFARMPEPRLGVVDARDLVEGALRLYRGGELSIERSLEEGRVNVDREQLQQVLLNLLENARDAIAQVGHGSISVAIRRAAGRVEIEVADTGPGISDEARAKLFTPYFTTKPHGTGLGLAIVHRIITDHHGEIRVTGAEGEGATFIISLPEVG
jgi:nitrogen fixation/metabolism regulation signal transduction histidine kinase